MAISNLAETRKLLRRVSSLLVPCICLMTTQKWGRSKGPLLKRSPSFCSSLFVSTYILVGACCTSSQFASTTDRKVPSQFKYYIPTYKDHLKKLGPDGVPHSLTFEICLIRIRIALRRQPLLPGPSKNILHVLFQQERECRDVYWP